MHRDQSIEEGKRNIGLIRVERTDRDHLDVGVIHMTYLDENGLQRLQAVSSINHVADFIGAARQNDSQVGILLQSTGLIVAGDLNASRNTPPYKEYRKAGLTELTEPLIDSYKFTWPMDINSLKNMIRLAGGEPDLDYKAMQRWMDYIFGSTDMEAQELRMLGTEPERVKIGPNWHDMYMSDHLAPAVYFP